MKKLIKTNKGIKSMSFEEVLNAHKNLLHKKANVQIGCGSNTLDRDDVFQELVIITWKCYEAYDIEKGYNFITQLEVSLRNRIATLMTKKVKKEQVLSLEEEIAQAKDDSTLGKDTRYFVDENNFENKIRSIVCINKEEEIVYDSLVNGTPKEVVCKQLGITRGGLYKKTLKMQKLFKERLEASNYNI